MKVSNNSFIDSENKITAVQGRGGQGENTRLSENGRHPGALQEA